jgi:hypothetical protein
MANAEVVVCTVATDRPETELIARNRHGKSTFQIGKMKYEN